MVRRLFSLLAALLLVAGAAPTAWAALADLGVPIAPHGYPAYYQDADGLQLELCLPAPAGFATRPDLCIFDPLDENSALKVTGESFWWLAQATAAMPGGGDAGLTLAVEATFGGNEAPTDGNQISFGRTRIRVDTATAGTYRVTHPYGTHIFESVPADANGINFTADIGAANFLNPALGFRGTLTAFGEDQVNFLTWPDYRNNPTLQVRALDPVTQLPTGPVLEQYVGNPNVASTVVGGSNGNLFRVERLISGTIASGTWQIEAETNLFFVMGKEYVEQPGQTAHVFPGAPVQKLYDVGPVNRTGYFADPDPVAPLVDITGVDYNYAVGYPLWYQENAGTIDAPAPGIRVTLCTPGDAMCISDPIDPTNPAHTSLRTGGEGFWWSADARFDTSVGRAALVLGVEATFGGTEAIVDGQQIAFGRERIRVDTPVAGTYRVTHPYATRIFTDVPAGDGGINFTSDIGIADPSDPDSAMVGTLYSDIGPTLLKWTTFNPDPALTDPLLVQPNPNVPGAFNYYVGNPGVERPVTGGPNGNIFRVERLTGGTVENGTWTTVGQTILFAVSGKVFDEATFEFDQLITNPPPGSPIAAADTATLDLNQAGPSLTIDVLANDTIVLPATVTAVTVVTQPASGTVAATSPVGTFIYTPSAALASNGGTDSFTYQITDSNALASNIATVTVTVIAVPPAEQITFNRARFNTRNLRLDLTGTSNRLGSVLTIYPGTTTTGTPLGTATVGDNGRWNLRAAITNPSLTSVTVLSNVAGAVPVTQPLDVR